MRRSSSSGASASDAPRSPPLVVTIDRRAWRGEDDARSSDLPRVRCHRRRHEPDVHSRAPLSSARAPVFHLDLYRLVGPQELTNIGWDEIVAEDALVLIEWPERAGERYSARPRADQSPASARRCRRATPLRGRPRMITLALDASTYVGDVALLDDGRAARRESGRDEGARERAVDAGCRDRH